MATVTTAASLAEKRRILQLETLYDLALALHAERPEEELVEELLHRVCTVLDPATAVVVTRDAWGGAKAMASVGWHGRTPNGDHLLQTDLWRELLSQGQQITWRGGEISGRNYREVLATPLAYRNVYLGFLALFDKEARGESSTSWSDEDRRFLESVASLVGVALDGARHMAELEKQRERLVEENRALKGQFTGDVDGQRIIASSSAMKQVLDMAERVAPRGISVLIRGESGTGKELIAKLLHFRSGREGPLIALNCAALPASLLESELFGIEGGVATGVSARRGKLELADHGTLFLDEIGDLEPALQVKLLRALQEREIMRVGGHSAVPVDVRVVAATHRDLESLVSTADFRGDLYYRLRGVEIELPPLRQRRREIPLFLRHFTERFCARENIAPPHFSQDALAALLDYDYPGNVRELQNLVEGAVSLADGTVDAKLIRGLLERAGDSQPDTGGPAEGDTLDLDAVERRHIARVLELTSGNKSAAAKMLGIDRRTLQRKGF